MIQINITKLVIMKYIFYTAKYISTNGSKMLHRLERAHIIHPASTEQSSAHPTTSLPSKNPRPPALARQHLDD